MTTGNKGAGRPRGSPNKATADARAAIAMFVENNVSKLEEWLYRVADGEKNDAGVYVREPNPAKAFDMFQSVVEYHVPKLARHEHAGDPNAPVVIDTHLNLFNELKKAVKLKKQVDANES